MQRDDKRLLKQITLLGILKKIKSESLDDVVQKIVDTGSYTQKEAKRLLKELRADGLITSTGTLSMKGYAKAKEAEASFRI